MLVSIYDTNNAVNLSEESAAAYIESLALRFVLEMLKVPPEQFAGRSVTTGATASNILALAVGREHAVKKAKQRRDGISGWSVAEQGHGHVDLKVYSAGAHASTIKAAAVNGLGRSNVVEITQGVEDEPCAFDLSKLETVLRQNHEEGIAAIVCASIGEVNTSGLTPEIPQIRQLCDKYEAFLHVDAAFGAFAVLHPDFVHLGEAMASAHSLTVDAHKWLNVPYDCAMFFCQDATLLHAVCGPGTAAAAYLAAPPPSHDNDVIEPLLKERRRIASQIPSPYYGNLENSRRFRALPLYASLVSLGQAGYEMIVRSNIEFARRITEWLQSSSDWDVLLPLGNPNFKVMNIVLFAPSSGCRDPSLRGANGASECVLRIKATRRVYVTGTAWQGRSAIRLAVSNWSTTIQRDFPIVTEVLQSVMHLP